MWISKKDYQQLLARIVQAECGVDYAQREIRYLEEHQRKHDSRIRELEREVLPSPKKKRQLHG